VAHSHRNGSATAIRLGAGGHRERACMDGAAFWRSGTGALRAIARECTARPWRRAAPARDRCQAGARPWCPQLPFAAQPEALGGRATSASDCLQDSRGLDRRDRPCPARRDGVGAPSLSIFRPSRRSGGSADSCDRWRRAVDAAGSCLGYSLQGVSTGRAAVYPRYYGKMRRPASSSISLTHAPCITSACIVRPACLMRRVMSCIALATSGWSGWPG
jgi:hypothetical protein